MSRVLKFLLGVFLFLATAQAAEPLLWKTTSAHGLFNVSVHPRAERYLIGSYHDWIITIYDQQQRPVENAQITVAGGMAQHGHGLPSQPLVTRYLGEGNYLIEGLLFNMAGVWTLLFSITTQLGQDQASYDLTLDF